MFEIEVAYAAAEKQTVLTLKLASATTVREAIIASDILSIHPELDLSKNKVGIFGKIVDLNTRVEKGNRVELYRALRVDPKEARRKRANLAGRY